MSVVIPTRHGTTAFPLSGIALTGLEQLPRGFGYCVQADWGVINRMIPDSAGERPVAVYGPSLWTFLCVFRVCRRDLCAESKVRAARMLLMQLDGNGVFAFLQDR